MSTEAEILSEKKVKLLRHECIVRYGAIVYFFYGLTQSSARRKALRYFS